MERSDGRAEWENDDVEFWEWLKCRDSLTVIRMSWLAGFKYVLCTKIFWNKDSNDVIQNVTHGFKRRNNY